MRYIVKAPLREHKVCGTPEVKLSLEEMQEIVGGHIESVHIPELEIGMLTIFCNEEGKLQHMVPSVKCVYEGEVYDLLCGNLIFLNYTDDGEKQIDLTDEQIQAVEAYLEKYAFGKMQDILDFIRSVKEG